MRKFLSAMSAIATLLLLAPSTGFAEPTHPNEVGLYCENEDGTGPTGTFVLGTPVDVYLVLTMPTDVENGDIPLKVIAGFEIGLHFDPVPNNDLFLLGSTLPPTSIDVGRIKDINGGIVEYAVGIGSAVHVVDRAVTLVKLTFLNLSLVQTQVTLRPVEGSLTLPGEMAYLGGMRTNGPYPTYAMYSVGGAHDAPVFIFNSEAVAVENESFGSVKALYR